MLELLVGTLLWYITDFNTGLSTMLILKTLFSNNIKTSLFLFINFLTLVFLGPSYIIFAKTYLLLMLGIFLYDKAFALLEIPDTEINKFKQKLLSDNRSLKVNVIYNKVKSYYDFLNLLVSIPIGIVYDNLNYYFNFDKYKNNKYYEKLEQMKNPEKLQVGNLPSLEKLNDCTDEELDTILSDMLNQNKFLEMTNGMRNNIGKKPLTKDDIDNNMNMMGMGSLFEMFNNSLKDLNNMIKEEVKSQNLNKNDLLSFKGKMS